MAKLSQSEQTRTCLFAAGLIVALAASGCYAPLHSPGIQARDLPDDYRFPHKAMAPPVNLAGLAARQPAAYLLGAGDLLAVTVPGLYAEAEVKPMQIQVSSNGKLHLPNVDPVQVTGLDLAQAQAVVNRAYSNGVVVRSHVNIALVQKAMVNVLVLGEVKAPGVYPLPRFENDVAHAIAAAGGLTLDADVKVEVHRRPNQPVRTTVQSMARRANAARQMERPQPHAVRPASWNDASVWESPPLHGGQGQMTMIRMPSVGQAPIQLMPTYRPETSAPQANRLGPTHHSRPPYAGTQTPTRPLPREADGQALVSHGHTSNYGLGGQSAPPQPGAYPSYPQPVPTTQVPQAGSHCPSSFDSAPYTPMPENDHWFAPSVVTIPLRGGAVYGDEVVTVGPGDIVVVPRRKQHVFYVVGRLSTASRTRFTIGDREREIGSGFLLPRDRDIDVVTAVAMAGYIDPIDSPTTVTVHRTMSDGRPLLVKVDLIAARYDARESIMVEPGDIVYLNPDSAWWLRHTIDIGLGRSLGAATAALFGN